MSTSPFERYPLADSLYSSLKTKLSAIGPFTEELKQTSAHLVAGKGAFLGVHPRSSLLIVNIVLARPLEGQRIAKCEQVSKSRFHNEVKVQWPDDLDDELLEWIREAYSLKVSA